MELKDINFTDKDFQIIIEALSEFSTSKITKHVISESILYSLKQGNKDKLSSDQIKRIRQCEKETKILKEKTVIASAKIIQFKNFLKENNLFDELKETILP